jgi:uncharacterized PurR-regulated membrane protein YhhQ (DUF165 family)
MKIALIVLYLAVIAAANLITSKYDPIFWGKLIIPAGSFLIGATFILRDLVQHAVGRRNTYLAIGAAMVLSAAMSLSLAQTLWITAASAAAFLVSESADTEIFTRLKLPLSLRVLYSGVVGGALDSVLFVLIGLSPLFTGILPWSLVGYAIAGQIVVKIAMQCLGVLVLQAVPKPAEPVRA